MTESLGIMKKMNDTSIDASDQRNNLSDKMLQYIQNNGMNGPVSSFNDDDTLFFMGTCDVSTTLAFDLEFALGSTIVSEYERDHGISPSIQFCFAYTTTMKNDGTSYVVRRLRVSNFDLEPSDVPEAITSSLDIEALGVVSFSIFDIFARYTYKSYSQQHQISLKMIKFINGLIPLFSSSLL